MDWALVSMLLISPCPSSSPEDLAKFFPVEITAELKQSIREFCVDLEILDVREAKYIMTESRNDTEEFYNDLHLLRVRYCQLKDAPRLVDCERWPARTFINEKLTFNRQYHRFIAASMQANLDRQKIYAKILRENDDLYRIWDKVRDSRCQYYYITVRRLALKDLKYMLGDDDYNMGALPPFVPIWRFREED